MKQVLILLFVFALNFLQAQEQIIPFEKGDVKVTGKWRSLKVKADDRGDVKIKMNDSNNFSFDINNRKLSLNFKDNDEDILIYIPTDCDLEVKADELIIMSQEKINEDERRISVIGLAGEVDINSSAHDIDVNMSGNSMTINSFHDIYADLEHMKEESIILLDSYMGNVELFIDSIDNSVISLRANEGKIMVDSLLKMARRLSSELEDEFFTEYDHKELFGTIGEGTSEIILRTDKGNHVMIDLENMNEDIRKLQLLDNPKLGFELLQNNPNPFKKKTKIDFVLPKAAAVKFNIVNVAGDTVFESEEFYDEGLNTIIIKKKDMYNGGVYYYTLESGDYKKTMKMIYID